MPTSGAKFAPKLVSNHQFYHHVFIQPNEGQPIIKFGLGGAQSAPAEHESDATVGTVGIYSLSACYCRYG